MRKRNKKRLIRAGFFYLPKGGYHSRYYSRGSLHPKNHRIQMRYLSRRQEVVFKGLVTAMNKGAIIADKLAAALKKALNQGNLQISSSCRFSAEERIPQEITAESPDMKMVGSPGMIEVTLKHQETAHVVDAMSKIHSERNFIYIGCGEDVR